MRLSTGERVFLAFTGLKGAVPVLLGNYIVSSGVRTPTGCTTWCSSWSSSPSSCRAPLVPTVARLCKVPMRSVELEPWALGVRLKDRPEGIARHVVEDGSAADGRRVDGLDIGEDTWISLVVREGGIIPVSGSAVAGGRRVLLITGDSDEECAGPFAARAGVTSRVGGTVQDPSVRGEERRGRPTGRSLAHGVSCDAQGYPWDERPPPCGTHRSRNGAPPMASIKVSDYILQRLRDWDVDHVFSLCRRRHQRTAGRLGTRGQQPEVRAGAP